MKIVFDPNADAAYIYISSHTQEKVFKTYICDPTEINGQINLDFDSCGHLIGIEVLDASLKLPKEVLHYSEMKY